MYNNLSFYFPTATATATTASVLAKEYWRLETAEFEYYIYI